MKVKRIGNKKATKRNQKQKINKNGIISLQYRCKFRIRLKNTLNNKIQESWVFSVYEWTLDGIGNEHDICRREDFLKKNCKSLREHVRRTTLTRRK